jgi:Na+/melibiose symporter-like transporter
MYTVGFLLSNVMPTLTVDGFGKAGLSDTSSWLLTSVIVAGLSSGAILFTGLSIREPSSEQTKPLSKFSLKTLAADYWQVLKLRPLRLLIFAVIAYLTANTLIVADRMYVFTFQMGYSGTFISMIMLLFGLLGIVLAIPMMKLAKRFDKRSMLFVCLGLGGCALAAMRFIGVSSLPALIFLMCVFAVASTAYWQLMPAAFYDICEVDEYENHVKRAGTITSTLPMAEAIASAVGMQVLGFWLQFKGFTSGATIQSPSALAAIFDCFTFVPGILLVVAALIMLRFPITKQRFETIKRALNDSV